MVQITHIPSDLNDKFLFCKIVLGNFQPEGDLCLKSWIVNMVHNYEYFV